MKETMERERKLSVDDDFTLPPLQVDTTPKQLRAMYYDTGDPKTIGAAVGSRVTAPSISYPTPAATAISTTSAHVSAIVDPHGATTRYV